MDYESVINKISGISTIDRKEGLQNLLNEVKSYCNKDKDDSANTIFLRNILKDRIKVDALFKSLGRLLRDPDWEIKRDSLEVIMGVIVKEMLSDESIIYIVVPHIILCLSDNKTTVRRGATQCLHELWLKSRDLMSCFASFVEHGLNRALDISKRRDNNLALQVLLTSHFSQADLTRIIDGVLLQLEIDSNDDQLVTIVCGVLRSIKKIIGEERFALYLRKALPYVTQLYQRCASSLDSRSPSSNTSGESQNPQNDIKITPKNPNSNKIPQNSATISQGNTTELNSNDFFLTSIPSSGTFPKKKLPVLISQTPDALYLGFIPKSVFTDIENGKKLEAIEEMYNLFTKIKNEKHISVILPYMEDLIQLIKHLMEDKYLVLMTAFKLLIDLVSSISQDEVDTHLDSLVQLLRMALSHNINGDAIIKKYVMAYSMVLFQKSNTKQLLSKLCDQNFMMDMKQASVRQTSIDIIMSALIKFPSNKFDLDFLTSKISQRLNDKKQKVKLASLECLSLIGYMYGNGKVNSMLKIIEQSTKFDLSNSLTELVQTRLSKHKLPHLDELGLVVYVTDMDKINSQRQHQIIDLDNSSSDNSPISSANAMETRRPSAGKVRGRAKFPWDQNEGNTQAPNPFSKAPGITPLNQMQPSDTMTIQLTHGPASVGMKQTLQESKTIKKLSDLQAYDNDHNHNRHQPISVRSNSSDMNPSNSMNTSGYSSNTNTSRRYTESFIKPNLDNSTATNSVNVTPRNPQSSRFEDNNSFDPNPIPTKPTLGRSAGTRRKELDLSSQAHTIDEDHKMEVRDIKVEAISSTMLDSVRNSAAKKKALTIFNSSTQKSSPNNTQHSPDLSVLPGQSKSSSGTKGPPEMSSSNKLNEVPIVYNPYKGATFKSNPQYDGLIVGKSVSSPTGEVNELLKKKQPVKGMLDTSSGNFTQRSTLNHTQSEGKKSYLNSEQSNALNNNPVNSDSPRNGKIIPKTSGNFQKETDFSEGIVGKGIVDRSGQEDESDEETHKGIMSNTLRESLSIKRQKATNDLNSSKAESFVSQMPPSPHSAPGSGTYPAANRKPPVGGYYQNNNSPSSAGNERDINYVSDALPPSRKPLRPSLGNSTPKKIKPLSQTVPNSSLSSAIDPTNASPAVLANPDKSIPEFLHLVENEDWENKIAALIIVQSLAQYHSETLSSRLTDLHSICVAVCRECKNLRSQVAKSAIQTVGFLFSNLRKTMDSELDVIIINMLSKGGDASSIFLRQDVESTLTIMIDNATPQRAIIPLITNGADNKNAAIRRLAASNIMQITEKLGGVKILSGAKEITEKLLQVVGKFIMDSNQETRYFAKRILLELSKNPDFEKIAIKSVPSKDVRILNEAIENLKLKGIGDPPQFSQSASIRRTNSLSRGGSAGNLVSLEQKSTTLSRGNSRSMSRLPGSELSEVDDDWLSKTCSDLASSDFRLRQNGLESLINRQEAFGLHIPQKGLAKLLNEFIPRLNDNNSKVAATALNVCRKVIPTICSIFPTEFISRLINTTALNFASKTGELRESASLLMNVCFINFDSNLLIQPCVEAMIKANVKTKATLIENINSLLDTILSSKSAASSRSSGSVNRHVVPQIGLLLEQNRPLPSTMRPSLHRLVMLCHEIVGPDFVDSASRERSHAVKQSIVDILSQQSVHLA